MFKNGYYSLNLFFAIMVNFIVLNIIFAEEVKTKSPTDVLAEVNGKQITRADFEKEFELYIEPMDNFSKNYHKEKEQKEQFLNEMAYSFAYEQVALKEGLDKTEDYKFIYKENFIQRLPKHIIDDIESKVIVSENEIKEYYEKNKEYFCKQKLYHIYQIISKDFDKSDSERARKKFDDYLNIKAIDFNKKKLDNINKKYIEAERTINRLSNPKILKNLENTSSDLGYCTLDFLLPEVASCVVNLGIASVSEEIILTNAYPNITYAPVQVSIVDTKSLKDGEKEEQCVAKISNEARHELGMKSNCYAVIRLIDVKEASDNNYELLKGQIKEILLQSKTQAAYEKYINDLKKELPFEMFKENIELLKKNHSFISYENMDKVVFKCGKKINYTLSEFIKYLQKLSIKKLCYATLKGELNLYYYRFCALRMANKYVKTNYTKYEKNYPDINSYARRIALSSIFKAKYLNNSKITIPEAKVEENFAQVKEAFKQPDLNDLIKKLETTEKKDYDAMKKAIDETTAQYENSSRAAAEKKYSSKLDDNALKEQIRLNLSQELGQKQSQDFFEKINNDFKIKVYTDKVE